MIRDAWIPLSGIICTLFLFHTEDILNAFKRQRQMTSARSDESVAARLKRIVSRAEYAAIERSRVDRALARFSRSREREREREERMRNNEYARRKYTLGEGANRGKKVPAARHRKTRTVPLDIWDGLLSVRTSASPSTSSFLLHASPRLSSFGSRGAENGTLNARLFI